MTKQEHTATSQPLSSSRGVLHLQLRLVRHLGRQRRFQYALLLVLTLASALAEVVSLGAVIPFVGVLTQPERVFSYSGVARFARYLDIESADSLLLPLCIAFGVAALIAASLRLSLLWVSIRLANATGADLSIQVYRRRLYQPYHVHIDGNSSGIISSITQKVAAATAVLTSLVTVVTSFTLFTAIFVMLLLIDPIVASVAMLGFGSAYALVAVVARRRLGRNSECIANEQTYVVKALQEGLGAIRDVLLDGTQDVYSGLYRKAVHRLQRAVGENAFINQAPRFAMEGVAMIMIAGLILVLSERPGGVATSLPILAALALGAQRMLPLMQQLYGNWSVVSGNHAALVDVLNQLEQLIPAHFLEPAPAPLAFKRAIVFDAVRFRYSGDGPWVVDGISLTIKKGSRIGFFGSTGSGKSTTLDLLMALLEPTEGAILVDGRPIVNQHRRAWQRTIAHVPQSIFLADATVAENIAFGVPRDQIDFDRVRQAAEQAQIADFIASSPDGYSALVGERGVRLSGGQRQRIGIARAMYKKATVLIFDEATSALDGETELAVMSGIESLQRDLTILIIAHRLSTLRHCDRIVQLERGRAVAQGTYEELLNSVTLQVPFATP